MKKCIRLNFFHKSSRISKISQLGHSFNKKVHSAVPKVFFEKQVVLIWPNCTSIIILSNGPVCNDNFTGPPFVQRSSVDARKYIRILVYNLPSFLQSSNLLRKPIGVVAQTRGSKKKHVIAPQHPLFD